jgi:hypothetical protein
VSFHTYFALSSGLLKPVRAPKGKLSEIMAHVHEVTEELGWPEDWDHWKRDNALAGLSDEKLCEIVERHNGWVRWLYWALGEWTAKPVRGGERITPKQAQQFWHALELLEVPVPRWTKDYFVARMEAIYAAMRGKDKVFCKGMTFDEKLLTPKQANAVMSLFDQYLDRWQCDLAVPVGEDSLYTHDDYLWCERCGAVTPEHAEDCRKRGCPVRAEMEI